MSAVSLERLEHELAQSLLCGPCAQGGLEVPAVALGILRETCEWGGDLTAGNARDVLYCETHRDAAAFGRIGAVHGPLICCRGCGRPVAGEPYSHILARIVPLGLSQ